MEGHGTQARTEALTLPDWLWAVPGDRTAVLLPDPGIRASFAALRDQVVAVAVLLAGIGVVRSTHVGIALPNRLPMIVCALAAAVAGTAAPLNPRYREEECRFYLGDVGARMLIVPPTGARGAARG